MKKLVAVYVGKARDYDFKNLIIYLKTIDNRKYTIYNRK